MSTGTNGEVIEANAGDIQAFKVISTCFPAKMRTERAESKMQRLRHGSDHFAERFMECYLRYIDTFIFGVARQYLMQMRRVVLYDDCITHL